MRIKKEKKNHGSKCRALPICEDITYWFCFTGAETELDKSKTTAKLNGKQTSIATLWDLYRTECMPFPDPPWFSLDYI